VQCPRSVEGSRQQGEVRLGEFLSPPEQAHGDKEISIGKKRTPEFRHRDRIRHGGDDSDGKDADRKTGGPRYLLLISHFVGRRDAASASIFVDDFSRRLHPMWRCQFTSDGFRPYVDAVEAAFGSDINFAQLIKLYGKPDNAGPDWYGPGKVIETIPSPISGNPELDKISTSHIERANLSFRTQLRRFTR
jgi:hypothetical protein